MANEVQIPKLGENIDLAEISSILVKVGDSVTKDQSLLEIESDKASVELPSPFDGVVSEIKVQEGDEVKIGQVVILLEGQGTIETPVSNGPEPEPELSESEPEPEPEAPSTPPAGMASLQVVEIPKLGENIDLAEVSSVLIKVGDTVTKDQSLLEIESDKASVELPSPYDGVIKEVNVSPGDEVKIGQAVIVLETSAQSSAETTSSPTATAASKPKREPLGITDPFEEDEPTDMNEPSAPEMGDPAPAAPSVRRLARELGIELKRVTGSGPGGRISKDDVKAFVKNQQSQLKIQPQSVSGGAFEVPDLPDFSKYGEIENKPISNVRRKTAEHMARSWSLIPHVTQYDSADITAIEKFRKARGKKIQALGGKLTVTAILIKIAALALKKFPKFCSSLDLKNKQIIYKKYAHIGVAVDTPRGLLVPVIRDADKKSLTTISLEMGEIAKRAREKKIKPEDLQGGTFTISNLGGLGTTYFTPIVNWPEVAILGVGRAKMEPVYIDGEFVPRFVMPLSVSYDHRIIDGADAARFLRWIAVVLEDPLMMVMEGDDE